MNQEKLAEFRKSKGYRLNRNMLDIQKATKCTDEQAMAIHDHINANWLLDWSECSMKQLNKVAREVFSVLYGESK